MHRALSIRYRFPPRLHHPIARSCAPRGPPTPDGTVSVKVKPGTQDGTLLRVKGKGAPKLKGSGRGDLLARIKVEVPKKLKKRERELLEELQKQPHDDPREALFS